MLKIGIVVLIIGYFIALFYTQSPNSSTPIFWFGFLFVLRSKQLANPENYWAKGARGGLFGHTLLYVTIIIFWNGGNGFIGYLSYVYRPITSIAQTFFQHQYIQNPAGSITDITTLIRAVTYNFLNICTYISIGAIIGKLFIKQKSS
jgi:cobalamin biosynthesis protein CobD/CbiB